MSEHSDEWVEGHNCALDGGSELDCPYKVGTDEAMDWADGFASTLDN